MGQVVQQLFCKHKSLSSKPSLPSSQKRVCISDKQGPSYLCYWKVLNRKLLTFPWRKLVISYHLLLGNSNGRAG
jgi:hypothetical protein